MSEKRGADPFFFVTKKWYNGFHQYRKVDVYAMSWTDIDLDKYIFAGGCYGGPIGSITPRQSMLRDERKFLLDARDIGAKPRMKIFTSSGRLISEFTMTTGGIVRMGWTEEENLVCVHSEGSVFIYSLHGERVASFHLGHSCTEDKVAECHIWDTGLVVRTTRQDFIAIQSFDNPQPYKLADVYAPEDVKRKPPSAMCVFPPRFNASEELEVWVATAEGAVMAVDGKTVVMRIPPGLTPVPIVKMSISPLASKVACFDTAGTLSIWSSNPNIRERLCSVTGGIPRAIPLDLVWCGEEAVVLFWDRLGLYLVRIFSPSSDEKNFQVDKIEEILPPSPHAVLLVGEIDGVRIIRTESCEFLEKVHESTKAIYHLQNEPGRVLYLAEGRFREKKVDADDFMRTLDMEQRTTAIEQCLEAAMHESEFEIQQSFLRAASFGKLWVENSDLANSFVDNCRTLRVLNAARAAFVGIPLTFEQWRMMEAEVLIDRLINRHHHLLALRICQYLRHNPERVLVHWACAKIKSSEEEDDDKLSGIIIDKLLSCPGLSFAKIATIAFHSGRRALAVKLLEHEPLATEQVPLLISMKEDDLALRKAIESGDTDLVYVALMHLKKTKPFNDFFELIRDKPLARNLYVSYCKQRDLVALKTFYYRMSQPAEAANVAVVEAYTSSDWADRIKNLKIALSFYEREKTLVFQQQLTTDQIRLLEEEAKAEAAGARGLVDLSVSELIERHIANRQPAQANEIKNMFGVPENRMWHLQVRTFAKNGLWEDLYSLIAKNKKPPIGFQPFIEACVEHKALEEAVKYIDFLPDPLEKMEWFCNIGRWEEATVLAGKERNAPALQTIRARCRNPRIIQQIDEMMARGI